jgi:hypothetical protein
LLTRDPLSVGVVLAQHPNDLTPIFGYFLLDRRSCSLRISGALKAYVAKGSCDGLLIVAIEVT